MGLFTFGSENNNNLQLETILIKKKILLGLFTFGSENKNNLQLETILIVFFFVFWGYLLSEVKLIIIYYIK